MRVADYSDHRFLHRLDLACSLGISLTLLDPIFPGLGPVRQRALLQPWPANDDPGGARTTAANPPVAAVCGRLDPGRPGDPSERLPRRTMPLAGSKISAAKSPPT